MGNSLKESLYIAINKGDVKSIFAIIKVLDDK